MSIMIKGMQMPESCFGCRFRHDGYCFAKEQQDNRPEWEQDKKPDWCPLIPVPPHGRLGDLDELYVHLNEWYLTNNPVFTKEEALYVRAMLLGIVEAPTIIPEDEMV